MVHEVGELGHLVGTAGQLRQTVLGLNNEVVESGEAVVPGHCHAGGVAHGSHCLLEALHAPYLLEIVSHVDGGFSFGKGEAAGVSG